MLVLVIGWRWPSHDGAAEEDASKTRPPASAAAERGGRSSDRPRRRAARHVVQPAVRLRRGRNSWRSGGRSWPSCCAASSRRCSAPRRGCTASCATSTHDLPDHYDWIGEGRAGRQPRRVHGDLLRHAAPGAVGVRPLLALRHPDVIGSRTWGNNNIRMVTWVRFQDRRTGGEFVVVNTHFDDESAELPGARRGADPRPGRRRSPPTLPVIVTGDFNDAAGESAPYRPHRGRRADRHLDRRGARRSPVVRAPSTATTRWCRTATRIDWMLTRGGGDRRGGGHQHLLPQRPVPVRPPADAGPAPPRLRPHHRSR